MTTVSRTLESPLGKFAMEKVNEALTVSEEYIEKYLPPSEEEIAEAEKGDFCFVKCCHLKAKDEMKPQDFAYCITLLKNPFQGASCSKIGKINL